MANKDGNNILQAIAHSGMGTYYFEQMIYDSALHHFNESLQLYEDEGQTLDVGKVKNNIALCYVNQNEYDLAKPFFRSALEIYARMDMQEDLYLGWYNIASTFKSTTEIDSALFYLDRAYQGSLNVNDVQLQLSIHELKADIFSARGLFDSAYHHQSLANILSDSVLSLEKVASLSEMQTKYETEKKEQELKLLNEENKAKTAQKRLLIAGTVVLGLILFILTYFYVQRQKLAKKKYSNY